MSGNGRIEIVGDWDVITDSQRPQMRLLCFPHAGGGAATYHRWTKVLSPHVRVCSVRLPGRENLLDMRPFTRTAAVVEELIDVLAPSLHSQYVVFGHSMGAILAFELVRQLRHLGLSLPEVLVVSGRSAPHLKQAGDPIHHLSDTDFIAQMRDRYQAIPQELLANPEALRLFIPAMRADMELVETWNYCSGVPLDIPLVVMGGEADPFVCPADITAWQMHTRGPFEAHFCPGGHFYLHEQSDLFIPFLAAKLRESIFSFPRAF
jgi:medium-chain acyl-[acyl-carrier-protein] hydrolase